MSYPAFLLSDEAFYISIIGLFTCVFFLGYITGKRIMEIRLKEQFAKDKLNATDGKNVN